MKALEDLITQKPHLRDTLRFYQKSLVFMDEVREFRVQSKPGLNSYPPEITGKITERFLSVFSLPEGSLDPLQQALELGEIDFRRIPLLEVPAFSLPYPEDDLTMLLFLISRPFFFGLRESVSPVREEGKGRCSVCGSRPSLVSLSEGKHRYRHCSFCGSEERDDSVGCGICHTGISFRSALFNFNDEPGFTFQICDECKSYRKVVDRVILSRMSPDLADLITFPLDIAMQDKGYRRTSPNPLGLLRMSAAG